MNEVGIIVNPASGKDIRRLISNGTVVTNQEKINQVIRMIMAMDVHGVDRVTILPDPTHMGRRIIDEVSRDLLHCRVDMLDLPFLYGTYKDSLLGSRLFRERGVGCILVLGGDGTCRVVAMNSGDVPLLAVSTGTNNVFPRMIEGTLAGIAAAKIATGAVSVKSGCDRAPRLDLLNAEGDFVDMALVDLAVLNARDLGSRAVWEVDSIRELFLTRASPASIGLSSIGGWLSPLAESNSHHALHIELSGDGQIPIMAPIAPGLMREVRVSRHQIFSHEDSITLTPGAGVIALDGEREVLLKESHCLTVSLNPNGPCVVHLERTLNAAAGLRH